MNMLEFIRLLENKISSIVLEDMTPDQARAVLQGYGAKKSDLSPDKLRSTWIKLVQQYHPDRTGGDSDAVARINAAYDVLKSQGNPASQQKTSSSNRQPEWQTDPRSGYNGWAREDYTDVNWLKKRMWELSGHSRHKWTLWAFDGKYFRASVTVFGTRDLYGEMARAMVTYTSRGSNRYPVEAVFAQDQDHPDVIVLIWLDGKDVRPPVPLEHESPNNNPSNDPRFLETLPTTLAQIATGRDT